MKPMTIYFDVCCLGRPFDDQSQDRVRIETEAIEVILRRVDKAEWLWVGSDAIWLEINRIEDADRMARVVRMTASVSKITKLTSEYEERAKAIETLGFKPMDALHIASAEILRADVFLTTDDRIEKLSKKHAGALKVRIANPLRWLEEIATP
jgi:predicted nucleic acid-binding protein